MKGRGRGDLAERVVVCGESCGQMLHLNAMGAGHFLGLPGGLNSSLEVRTCHAAEIAHDGLQLLDLRICWLT